MGKLTINAADCQRLREAKGMLEIFDPDGRVVGRFLPLPDLSDYELTESPTSEEELSRSEQELESYSTVEVLNHLKRLP